MSLGVYYFLCIAWAVFTNTRPSFPYLRVTGTSLCRISPEGGILTGTWVGNGIINLPFISVTELQFKRRMHTQSAIYIQQPIGGVEWLLTAKELLPQLHSLCICIVLTPHYIYTLQGLPPTCTHARVDMLMQTVFSAFHIMLRKTASLCVSWKTDCEGNPPRKYETCCQKTIRAGLQLSGIGLIVKHIGKQHYHVQIKSATHSLYNPQKIAWHNAMVT